MRLQTDLLSLLLLALVLASYVDASAKKKKKNKKGKGKNVPILNDTSTGRGDAVTISSLPTLVSNSKPKSRPNFPLVDMTSTVAAVQPGGRDALASDPQKAQSILRKERQILSKFETLIDQRQYGIIIKRSETMSDGKIIRYICPVITTLNQFKGIYEHLKQRNMIPGFLAHGEMVLVKKVITETNILKTDIYGVSVTAFTMQ